jgi:hypothetical protein
VRFPRPVRFLVPIGSLLIGTSACSNGAGDAAIATPSMSAAQSRVTAGTAIDLTYRFAMSPGAPALDDDHMVFVHVFDARGERLWTGDHQPPTPTRRWTAGSVVEYVRPMSVPWNVPGGRVSIEMGIYSPRTGERLTLAGDDRGRRSYRVASLDVVPHSDPPAIFVEGWHGVERAANEPGVEWHWSAGAGTIWLRNPRRDAVLVVDADQPMVALGEPQRVTVRIGPAEVGAFSLAPGQRATQRVAVAASQLGDEPLVRIVVAPERTFVPAAIPAAASGDTRTLGVRVFSAYFESPPQQ